MKNFTDLNITESEWDIKCMNIENYTFRGKKYKVILFTLTSKLNNDCINFTVDVEIGSHYSLSIVSHHVNIADSLSIPKLYVLNKSDHATIIDWIRKYIVEVI